MANDTLNLAQFKNQAVTVDGKQIAIADYLAQRDPEAYANTLESNLGNGINSSVSQSSTVPTSTNSVSSNSDMLSAVGLAKSNLQAGTNALVANAATQSSVQDIITATMQQSARDASLIQSQAGKVELDQQQARNKIGNLLGTDVRLQSELISSLTDEATQAYNDRASARADITKKQTTSIFDDPIGFIVNKFTINDDIAKHNDANQRLTNAEERLMAINAATEATAKTQLLFGESLTAATQDAKSRQVAVQATVNAQQSAIQSAVYNANGINAVMAMNKENISIMFQEENAKNAKAHLEATLSSLDLQRQKFENEKLEFADKMKMKRDSEETDSSILKDINTGLKATGQPELTGVNGKQALTLIKANSPLAKKWADYYQMGQQSNTAGFPVVGTSIGNTANVMNDLPVQIAPIQQPVKDVISAAYKDVMKNHATKYPALDIKDRNAVATKVSEVGEAILATQAAEVDPTKNPSNVYNVGSFNALASSSPVIQALPLWQKVFSPTVNVGQQVVDPKLIWQQTMDAVASKKISYNEALDGITTMFHVGVASNIAARKFASFGIVPSESYNASVNTGTADFGPFDTGIPTKTIVDLTKPDAVARTMNTYLVRKLGSVNRTGVVDINSYKPDTSINAQIPQ